MVDFLADGMRLAVAPSMGWNRLLLRRRRSHLLGSRPLAPFDKGIFGGGRMRHDKGNSAATALDVAKWKEEAR